ncbi:MAG TPA: hypothetical protein VFE91_06010 [Nitrososphaerales archaeon]|nr:hypothetical protein [Nitrososphaerales archaeon]
MWLEIIVGGGIVTFSNVGMLLNEMGKDPRCEWAARIEERAQKVCGRKEGVRFGCRSGDMSIWLNEDAVLPVVRAINEALPDMPDYVKGFFQRVAYLVENGERVRLIGSS